MLSLSLILLPALLLASNEVAQSPDETAVGVVIHEDESVRRAAIDTLRDQGPAGLDLLLKTYPADVKALRTGYGLSDKSTLVREAIAAVAGQRDAHHSGLYWYTDLERAKQASVASGKPILSLRLLGRLDEDLRALPSTVCGSLRRP